MNISNNYKRKKNLNRAYEDLAKLLIQKGISIEEFGNMLHNLDGTLIY